MDKIMFSGSPQLMILAIQMKTNEMLQYAECLNSVDFSVGAGTAGPQPRLIQFIQAYEQG
jgi:hypothetical protein